MKKFTLLALLLAGAWASEAKSLPSPLPVAAVRADSTLWKDYVGKYKGVEGSFDSFIVTIENGKLMGEATGQGKGELVADQKQTDVFNVPGYDATVTFVRDDAKKVIKYKLAVQGQEFEGEKL